ncbi:MAG: sensor histidine kinase [Cellulosilyticaceae bacterium]
MKKKVRIKIKPRIEAFRVKVLQLYRDIKIKISKSIKLEIVTLVAIALVMATVLGVAMTQIGRSAGIGRHYYTSYEENRNMLQERLGRYVQEINNLSSGAVDIEINSDTIKQIIERPDKQQAVVELEDYISQVVDGFVSKNTALYERYSSEYGESSNYSAKIAKMYDELKKLNDADRWTKEVVDQKVRGLFNFGKLLKETRQQAINEIIMSSKYELEGYVMQTQTYLVDSYGQAIYQDGFVQTINMVEAIGRAGEKDDEQVTSVYPVIVNGEIGYFINESIIRGRMVEYYSETALVLGWVVGMITFVLLIFRFTRAKIRYIEYISYCLTEISKGNLYYKVEVVGEDELAQVATDIAHMESEIRHQIEAQKQAEKVKNELITNVAHDLRTPLTSIIGYMGLLKDEKYTSEEERQKYMEIAYQKSEKLKVLIEDLFEYTKLHNQETDLKLESVSLTHLLNQLAEELMPLAEEKNIRVCTHIHTENARVTGDVQKLMRAFENLIGNAIKYSIKGADVHIQVAEDGDHVIVAVQNQCEHVPEGDLNKLFDRFYRTDASRNSETGGSGLGLAIAKNIVTLHGGQIWVQAKDDLISFNIKLRK